MTQTRFTFTLVSALVFFSLSAGSLNGQNRQFDYEHYPRLNFSFAHLDLELNVDPDKKSLKGMARYRAEANISGVDSLILQAAHMEITNVKINEKTADYNLHNDSLLIALPGSSEQGEKYTVSVAYTTVPRFGILSNARGSLWTSLLPQSKRHWLPAVDHPRVSFTTSMEITVPSGYRAVASGVKSKEEILDIEKVRFTYQSENPVPVSALTFAVGKFDDDQTSFGIKNITVHSEKDIHSEKDDKAVLEQAYTLLNETEEKLGMEYPFDRLHIVVLDDHMGETKSWGASTVFLYKNRGDLNSQLRRGIYAQWFGVHQREERWSDAQAVPLLQTALHYSMIDSRILLETADYPFADSLTAVYENFGPQRWNLIQRNFSRLEPSFRETVSSSLAEIATWPKGVYAFRDYGEYWYDKTGQPIFSLPVNMSSSREQGEADTTVYRVDYQLDEAEGQLKLTFKAKQGGYKDLVSLPVVKISAAGSDTSEVTFTGFRDSVIVQVPAMIHNVEIIGKSRPQLILDEYKPASFLLYVLKNDTATAAKAEAAGKLGFHAGNPDLQLAIGDLLKRDLAPRVRAALLHSYGRITAGANGTEEVFIDALDHGNTKVQLAGLDGLQNYRDTPGVAEAVRSYVLRTDSLAVFKNAARVLASVIDTSSFENFATKMVRTDTAGHKAVFALQVMANTGNTEQAVRQAEFYIEDVYDYSVRARALGILFQHESMVSGWEGRMERLLADTDPRIRYLAVWGLKRVATLKASDFIEPRMLDEYDERVFKAMREAAGN